MCNRHRHPSPELSHYPPMELSTHYTLTLRGFWNSGFWGGGRRWPSLRNLGEAKGKWGKVEQRELWATRAHEWNIPHAHLQDLLGFSRLPALSSLFPSCPHPGCSHSPSTGMEGVLTPLLPWASGSSALHSPQAGRWPMAPPGDLSRGF